MIYFAMKLLVVLWPWLQQKGFMILKERILAVIDFKKRAF